MPFFFLFKWRNGNFESGLANCGKKKRSIYEVRKEKIRELDIMDLARLLRSGALGSAAAAGEF